MALQLDTTSRKFNFLDLSPRTDGLQFEAMVGLRLAQKKISPKFLYDRRGSELFEKICDVKEYYPTRTEISILQENAKDIAWALGHRSLLIEFGSGASRKTRILLDHMLYPFAYAPIDISRQFLLETVEALQKDYPKLPILPICADFTLPLTLSNEVIDGARRLVAFFPGSTIGNFEPLEAQRFLKNTARLLGPGGLLLIGVDLLKSKAVLEAAYDDSERVTAEFNLNLLHRMNAELDADFDVSAFRHRAVFNETFKRVEMHIESLKEQDVTVAGDTIHFHQGETIHTESSHKYDLAGFSEFAGCAGFATTKFWTDPERKFGVFLLSSTHS